MVFVGASASARRNEKRAQALATGAREDINMLDKAPNGKVSDLLNALDKALSAGEVEHAIDLSQTDCYWRDLVTFTWNIKTMDGQEQVRDMLKARLADTKPSNWKIADGEDASEADGITESWIQFETEVARGFGHMRLKDGRIWTLLTTMSELKGYEEPVGFDRPMGAKHGAERNRKTWKEEREAEAAELGYSRQPYCVIVGGGQGGIALGARLRQLNVPTIIIEKNDGPGDSWRKRYKSLCLHDPVWYDHLPYLPFPRNWPVFSPKDKIGDWLEMYTKVMELNYWGSTECKKATYDERSREWTVVVRRDGKVHYLMRVLPYRTEDGTVDGVLVTFTDITRITEFEEYQEELGRRVEGHIGQRDQQRRFHRRHLPDGVGPAGDAALVVNGVTCRDQRVELGHVGHGRDRDKVTTAKSAHLSLHAALLVGAGDPRGTKEAVEPVVGPQGREPLGLDPVPAEQDLRHRGAKVVIADPAGRSLTSTRRRRCAVSSPCSTRRPPRPGTRRHDRSPTRALYTTNAPDAQS